MRWWILVCLVGCGGVKAEGTWAGECRQCVAFADCDEDQVELVIADDQGSLSGDVTYEVAGSSVITEPVDGTLSGSLEGADLDIDLDLPDLEEYGTIRIEATVDGDDMNGLCLIDRSDGEEIELTAVLQRE